jgi:transcription regulator MmyB-like protein
VPPRGRNDLLAAAGYAPIYRESDLDAPEMAGFRRALDFILRQQEPYPAIVLDRYWNVVLANRGTERFMGLFLDPETAAALGPPNGLRLICHPEGLRPYIVNWDATAAALIQWLQRDLLRSADPGIRLLLNELLSYPDVPRNWRRLDLDAPTAPFLAIEMEKGEARLRFFTTLTTLGTPYDITLHELRIESFFPADDSTDLALRRLSAAGVT